MANYGLYQGFEEKEKLISRIVWLQKKIQQNHSNYDEHGLMQCDIEQLHMIYDGHQAMYDEEQAETSGYTNGHDKGDDKQYHADQINRRTQQKGYTQNLVSNWGYFQLDELNTNERMMILVLLRYGWNAGRCTIYQSTLKNDMGCSVSTVYRTQTALEEKGWIKVIGKYGNKSTYQILKKEVIPPRFKRK
jgi:hypothetical protein